VRTTEAARYARWSAMVAALIAVVVAGVYVSRVWREAEMRRHAPPPVPAAVQQQSAEFSFSRVEGNRTLFTVRASRATEFKDQNNSVLEDVWITIYGRQSNRYDNIHAQRCNYEPSSGRVVCQGDVQIDLESSEEARQSDSRRIIHLATKNISFNRDTGEVATEEPVEFRFPSGEGSGTGIVYRSREEQVRLSRDVELKISQRSASAPPVIFTGSSLEFRRDEQAMHLLGPVRAQQGERELTAGNLTIELDAHLRARRAVAKGKPELRSTSPHEQATVAAESFVAQLDPDGWIEQVTAESGVRAGRTLPTGHDNFEAQHVDIWMEPKLNQPRQMTATGSVRAASREKEETRRLETAALELRFTAGGLTDGSPRPRRIESFETKAPGTIETKTQDESTRIHAGGFTATFAANGRMEQLLGRSGVAIDRQLGKGASQTSTADNLALTFGPGRDWSDMEETGHVKLQQGGRTAQAGHVLLVRATDLLTLDDSPKGAGRSFPSERPSVADSQGQTTAVTIEINQRTGDARATGNVVTSLYSSSRGSQGGVANFGPGGIAHISADRLTADNSTGQAVYSGHARLWQGGSVIEAETMELGRSEQRLEARNRVIALLPQSPSPPNNQTQQTAKPILWRVQAPRLQYWSEQGRALFEGGVRAESQQGELLSRTLELFLAPSPPGAASAGGQRQLSRGLARGGVVVRQGGRQGTAEQAEYFAADGKFVLSGGQPTLTDASRDTTTGRQLTFFTASDTILIESETDLRTLTKHRVEK
jgi:LPS export ABC transporter protein LptC